MAQPLSPRLLRNNSRPQWLADDLMTHQLRLCPKASPQQLKASMIQWLADDPMARQYEQTFLIRPEALALARQLDYTIDVYYNDEMSEKATMQIGR